MDGSQGTASTILLKALDSEIAGVKSDITYYRTVLLAAAAAVSALFWDLFRYVPEGGIGNAQLLGLMLYVLPALYFIAGAVLIMTVYEMRSARNTQREDTSSRDYLPHIIVLILIVLLGLVSSSLALAASLLNKSEYGLNGQVAYASSLIVFLAVAWTLLHPEGLHEQDKKMSERFETLGRPDIREYIRSKLWKFAQAVAFIIFAFAVLLLQVAWSVRSDPVYSEVALKGVLALALTAYALERIGKIRDRFVVLDALKESRRNVWSRLLESDTDASKILSSVLDDVREVEGLGKAEEALMTQDKLKR